MKLNEEAVRRSIRGFVDGRIEESNLGVKIDEVRDDDSLINLGIIDSLGIMLLIDFIEERFLVSVPTEELIPENFDSVDSITSYIIY